MRRMYALNLSLSSECRNVGTWCSPIATHGLVCSPNHADAERWRHMCLHNWRLSHAIHFTIHLRFAVSWLFLHTRHTLCIPHIRFCSVPVDAILNFSETRRRIPAAGRPKSQTHMARCLSLQSYPTCSELPVCGLLLPFATAPVARLKVGSHIPKICVRTGDKSIIFCIFGKSQEESLPSSSWFVPGSIQTYSTAFLLVWLFRQEICFGFATSFKCNMYPIFLKGLAAQY